LAKSDKDTHTCLESLQAVVNNNKCIPTRMSEVLLGVPYPFSHSLCHKIEQDLLLKIEKVCSFVGLVVPKQDFKYSTSLFEALNPYSFNFEKSLETKQNRFTLFEEWG